MANFSLNLTGIESLRAGLERALTKIEVAERNTLKEVAEEIMETSQVQVPRDTGALADSRFIEDKSVPGQLHVRVGYGGNSAQINPKTGQSTEAYMLEVHEDLETYHPTGKAKFLEDPVNEKSAEFLARVGRRIL